MISDRRLVINAELNELRKAHTESTQQPHFRRCLGDRGLCRLLGTAQADRIATRRIG